MLKQVVISIAILHSLFMGLYATTIYFDSPKLWKTPFQKQKMTPYDVYEFIINALGTASGWIAAYYLLFTKNNYPNISIADLFILLTALLGTLGFMPKVLASFDLGWVFKGKDSRSKDNE